MDIREFFAQSAGKWFSQRTRYNLAPPESENSKSEITIEVLSQDHPEVVKLCEQNYLNPTVTWGGAKISWDNSADWGKEKNKGSTVIVPIPDADNPKIGKFLRKMSSPEKTPLTGRYIIGKDESLTLIAEDNTTYSEERLWFASPNLRLRTSLLKRFGGFSIALFYSEIRKIPPKPQQPTKDTATNEV